MAVKKTRGGHAKRSASSWSEVKESGGEGRTSKTMGARGAEEGSGSSMGETSGRGGRYSLDCTDAGQGCSLKVSGTYDEVLSAGVQHARSAHGMTGSDKDISEDIKSYIKEDQESSGLPGTFQGRGASQSGRSPGLPS